MHGALVTAIANHQASVAAQQRPDLSLCFHLTFIRLIIRIPAHCSTLPPVPTELPPTTGLTGTSLGTELLTNAVCLLLKTWVWAAIELPNLLSSALGG